MKTYETKIEVLAKPMTAGEYNQEMGFQLRNAKGELYSETETGYFVKVSGTVKWMPKEDFENEFKCVETWKDRLVIERDELLIRVTKLRDFINSKTFDHVSNKQGFLLREQLHYMQCYLDILNDRLTKLQEGAMWFEMDKIMIEQRHVDSVRKYLGEENLRYFRHLKGLKGEVFPVLKLNYRKKGVTAHPVGLREGMKIRNWMRVNFPEFTQLSQNKIEKLSEELINKAIIFESYFEIIDDSTDKAIDWEQRRYEIAKDALAGIISEESIPGVDPFHYIDKDVSRAIEYADELIKRLKAK